MKILNEIYEIIKDKEFTDEEIKELQEKFYKMLNDEEYINEDFELDYIKGDEYDIDQYFNYIKGKFKLSNDITEENLINISNFMKIEVIPFRRKKMIEHYYNMKMTHGYY